MKAMLATLIRKVTSDGQISWSIPFSQSPIAICLSQSTSRRSRLMLDHPHYPARNDRSGDKVAEALGAVEGHVACAGALSDTEDDGREEGKYKRGAEM